MNERIKALAIEAGGGPSKWYNDPDVLEYFTELIVKECCDIFVQLRTRPADLAAKDVKQHFGVTE